MTNSWRNYGQLLLFMQAFISTFSWVLPKSSSEVKFPRRCMLATKRCITITTLFSNQAETSSSVSNGSDDSPKSDSLTSSVANPSTSQPPSTAQVLAALGTSPRRVALSFLSATGIALAANFVGITSSLLNTLPEDMVESSGLDTFYPRGNYKRYKTDLYTFVFPKQWVADTSLELAKAQRRAATLDYRMRQNNNAMLAQLPDAAFGPAGNTKGDTNVSVLRSNIPMGSFETLKATILETGPEKYLSTLLAPEGSGRTVSLISAMQNREDSFQVEYYVEIRGRASLQLRAISVIAAPSDQLLTLTVVSPAENWTGKSEKQFRAIASSFHTL